jgi:hypothetical protein
VDGESLLWEIFKIWRAGSSHGSGTRASANTSGPDFMAGFEPDEIADLEIRTERRKLVSSAGPVFVKSELFRKDDPAV